MTGPLVSIVTPSFNRAEFIEATIASVSAQTYRKIDHMVVDGGSSDGTDEILKASKNSGVLNYLSEPDHGMYDAINKGLGKSHGQILAYLNTDDRYMPWTVETAVRYFADHEDVDAIYGDTIIHDIDKKIHTINILPRFSSMWLRCGGIIPQPTVFFRRRVYDRLGGFQQAVSYLADCEYWLRMDRAGMRFRKLNEVLALETNHAGTIRQKLAETLITEKRFLVRTFGGPVLGHPLTSRVLLRAKYAEKELFVALFMLANKLSVGGWPRFRATYRVDIDVASYYADKILRMKSDYWKLEKRNG